MMNSTQSKFQNFDSPAKQPTRGQMHSNPPTNMAVGGGEDSGAGLLQNIRSANERLNEMGTRVQFRTPPGSLPSH